MQNGPGRLRRLSSALGETLFPDPPRPSTRLGRGESIVVGCSLLAIAVILVLLRLGLTSSLNSLWAEDSTVFLGVALTQGFWEGVLAPYTNYLVFLPRLITEGAAIVPIEDAPAAVSILSAAVTALSGLAVWHATPGHIRSAYLRGALAVAAVLVPVASLESIDSAAYASWYMLFATFWLLLWRPRTDWGALLGSLFILLTALSNASVWFFVPLAVLRAIAIRDRRDAMIVAAFAIGAAIQVPVALTHQQLAEPTWSADIWTAYVQRIVDGAVLGLHLGGGAWSDLGWSFLGPLLVLGLFGLFIGLRRAGPPARALAVIAVATSFVMFAGIAYQREVGPALVWEAGEYSGAVGRYAIVPALMLLSAAVVLVDSAVRRSSGAAWGRWAIAATTLVIAVSIATSFDESNPEARGRPDWSTALKGAARECEAEPAQEVAVPTSPPGFGITLPCDLIPGWPQPRPPS